MGKLSPNLHNKLQEIILMQNLQEASSILFRNAVECWSLVLSEPEDYSVAGNCRIGGDPDLPSTVKWPQTAEGMYLNFIMQINLAELPARVDHPLPSQGMLYFFIESDECCTDVASKLIYYDGDMSLLGRVESPDYDQLVHEYYIELEPYKLLPIVTADLPELGSEVYEIIEKISSATDSETIAERYCQLLESISGAENDMHVVCKLFGHASEVNGDMRWNASLAKAGQDVLIYNFNKQMEEIDYLLEKSKNENETLEIEYYQKVKDSLGWYQQHKEQLQKTYRQWLPFLKIDSNRSVDLSIWDAGSFNILIREEDLRNLNFSDIYVEIMTE